jgi:selenocysteine lyase/cysteine desulfurase
MTVEMTEGVRGPDLLAYRDEFPLLSRATYLNTCSLGALPRRGREKLHEFLDQWESLGASAWYGHWMGELEALREDFGWVIGRPGSEIALAPNVSVALASFASALDPLHRGDEATTRALGEVLGWPPSRRGPPRTRVITTALDFPTLGHQWLARAPLGVELVVIPSPDGLTVPLHSFASAIDERTALVATGHVYYTTGAVQDLAGLARICHDRGALLLADAYQATGLIPTDAAALGVDAYVSGTLKWLFGGPGNAFLWLRAGIREALMPTTTGWFSGSRQFEFDVASLDFAEDGRKFEMGTPAVPSAFLARGGMSLVREIGVERLHARTVDLGSSAIRLAEAEGLEARAVRDDALRAGMLGIRSATPGAVVAALAAEGIIVDARPGIVRLSPAFYNTESEVADAVETIARITRDGA